MVNIDNRLMTDVKNMSKKLENLAKDAEVLGTTVQIETSNISADINNLRGEVLNLQTSTTKSKGKSIKVNVKDLDSIIQFFKDEGIIERKQLNAKHPETDVIDRESLCAFLRKATSQDWQVSRIGTMFVAE